MKAPSIIAVVALTIATSGHAQSYVRSYMSPDFGRIEFKTNCASCHGEDGKGYGPIVDLLKKPPPDLTRLAKANNGVLPIGRIYDTISGNIPPAHGGRDMPVWGNVYRIEAANYYGEVPYDAEAYVRGRILYLVEFINRMQQK
jgi:hypothetical protein